MMREVGVRGNRKSLEGEEMRRGTEGGLEAPRGSVPAKVSGSGETRHIATCLKGDIVRKMKILTNVHSVKAESGDTSYGYAHTHTHTRAHTRIRAHTHTHTHIYT